MKGKEDKNCIDCKYYLNKHCLHPYKDKCIYCSLWWPKKPQVKITTPKKVRNNSNRNKIKKQPLGCTYEILLDNNTIHFCKIHLKLCDIQCCKYKEK